MGNQARQFGHLRPLAYDGVIVDPPWQYRLRSVAGETKAPQAHYHCMTLEEIQALPVAMLLRGDGLVMLWATFPMLREGLATLDAWGLRYVTGGVWHKKSSTGRKTTFGTGYCLRSSAEPFLLGAVGHPRYSKAVRNLIEAPVRGHSRKPDDQYGLMERLLPAGREFAEVFATQTWPGWDSFGDQIGKWDAAAE